MICRSLPLVLMIMSLQSAKANFYQMMGLSYDASSDQIKRAYRRLAVKWHPDKNPGDLEAERKFKELVNAHDTLMDAEKRRTYDHDAAHTKSDGYNQYAQDDYTMSEIDPEDPFEDDSMLNDEAMKGRDELSDGPPRPGRRFNFPVMSDAFTEESTDLIWGAPFEFNHHQTNHGRYHRQGHRGNVKGVYNTHMGPTERVFSPQANFFNFQTKRASKHKLGQVADQWTESSFKHGGRPSKVKSRCRRSDGAAKLSRKSKYNRFF